MSNLLTVVDAPKQEIARYGLLSLGDPVAISGTAWEGGYTYASDACRTGVYLSDMCAEAPGRITVIEPGDCESPEIRPVTVEFEDISSTFGNTRDDRRVSALDAAELCTQKALEFELWEGKLGIAAGFENKRLADPSAVNVTPGGSPVKVKYGLALLEQALANAGCGLRGVIHANRAVGSVLGGRDVDGHLETPLGNLIVAGTGYTGVGPDGTMPAAGTWMYATGMVTTYLGEAFVPAEELAQRVDTSVNTITTKALRVVSADFDGCAHFAVLVDLTLDYA